MDFRCSKSAVGAAILCGGVAFTLLLPEHCAADPIEFSAPLVPLAVPHPVRKVKEEDKAPMSRDSAGAFLDDAPVFYSPSVVVTKSKSNDPWSLDSNKDSGTSPESDAFAHSFGNESAWFSSILNGNTNAMPLKKPLSPWDRGENNSNNLLHRNDRNDFQGNAPTRDSDSLVSRFAGDQTQGDRNDSREMDRLNRYSQNNGNGSEESAWRRVFGRDSGSDSSSSTVDRYGYAKSGLSADEAAAVAMSGSSDRSRVIPGITSSSPGAAGVPNMPFGTGTYIPPAGARPMDENFGRTIPGYTQMRDPTVAPQWATRNYGRGYESRMSRSSQGGAPAVLAMPKRPSDP